MKGRVINMESKRLLFRPFTYEDDVALEAIMGDEEVCRYLPGDNKKSKEEMNRWLQYFIRSFNDEQGNKIYAIITKDTNELIGYGGLSYVKEFDKIEIMYGFKQSSWNKGYASEAGLKFKELAKEVGLEQVIALSDVRNIASQKVLLKIGFEELNQLKIWGIDAFYYEMDIEKS